MKITVIRQPDAEETEVTITCRELKKINEKLEKNQ
jgi:hypothetical protein